MGGAISIDGKFLDLAMKDYFGVKKKHRRDLSMRVRKLFNMVADLSREDN